MVSVLAFYLDNPSLNAAEVYSFYSLKLLEKNENKQKEAGDGHSNSYLWKCDCF